MRTRDHFDFDFRAFRQSGHLYGRAGRGLAAEIGAVDLVDYLEIAEVGEKDRCFQYVGQREAFRFQNTADVVHHPPGLRCNVVGHNLPTFGVQRNLAAAKDKIAGTNGLRIRADGGRGIGGRDNFLHPARLAAAEHVVIPGEKAGPGRKRDPDAKP